MSSNASFCKLQLLASYLLSAVMYIWECNEDIKLYLGKSCHHEPLLCPLCSSKHLTEIISVMTIGAWCSFSSRYI